MTAPKVGEVWQNKILRSIPNFPARVCLSVIDEVVDLAVVIHSPGLEDSQSIPVDGFDEDYERTPWTEAEAIKHTPYDQGETDA